MLYSIAAVLAGPYPEDCTKVGSATQPHWYKDCTKAVGGCFTIAVPKEADYNIGPTVDSHGHEGSGTEWCADHLNGFVYARVNESSGAQFFDETQPTQPSSARDHVTRVRRVPSPRTSSSPIANSCVPVLSLAFRRASR